MQPCYVEVMPSRLRRSDVVGHAHFWTISCYNRLSFFWWDPVKQVAIDGLASLRQKHRICLLGYVIMPEHVHVLLFPRRRYAAEPVPISRLLADFKQYVGFYGKRVLRDYWRQHRRLWSMPLNDWASGRLPEQAFWTTRGYDFDLYGREKVYEKLEYCHNNPVRRGLVAHAVDWQWSSCRFFELGERSVLAMDWDGGWPIDW